MKLTNDLGTLENSSMRKEKSWQAERSKLASELDKAKSDFKRLLSKQAEMTVNLKKKEQAFGKL